MTLCGVLRCCSRCTGYRPILDAFRVFAKANPSAYTEEAIAASRGGQPAANGHSNGHENGHSNGDANGGAHGQNGAHSQPVHGAENGSAAKKANGKSNGKVRRLTAEFLCGPAGFP